MYLPRVILSPAELAGLLAREYLRVSDDKTGNLDSPAEQHAENQEHAGRNGWRLGDPYAEPAAVSASRWSDKARAEFERLVSDLLLGTFGARILILWESSRGGRSVSDWVRLVDACESARVLIYVTTHVRVYDPANARDRRSLLEDAVDAEYDNAKRRTAVVRTTTARAARGEPHGRVPYGYRRVYDPLTRRLAAQEPDPGEAPLIKEIFTRLHAGEAVNALERDFARRGLTTRGSKKVQVGPWTHDNIIRVAVNPVYAGLRTRQPKGTPRRRGSLDGAVKGTWPAIVDEELFHSVRVMMLDPGRRKSRDARARHLLSLIAVCAVCGGPLTVRRRRGERCYDCRGRGCVGIPADDLDAYATAAIQRWLSQPGIAARLRPVPGALPELDKVRAELAETRGILADWQDRAARLEVTPESFARIEPPIVAKVSRLEARARELGTPPELAGWTGTAAEVKAKWDSAPADVRRRIARKVLSLDYLGLLAVTRVPVPGLHVPAAERVKWVKPKQKI